MPKINIGFDELTIHYFSEGKRERGEYAVEVSGRELKFLRNARSMWEKSQSMLGKMKTQARKQIRRNPLITKHYPR